MKLFASWSGGKDCMLALYRTIKAGEHEIEVLVNMCDSDGALSRSHGLKADLIHKQAELIGISIIQKETDRERYEQNFKSVIQLLKEQGVEGGVFGDIYLKEHRIWIERVCREMDITPIFPLWEEDTTELLNEFIESGFKTITVSVNMNMLGKEWLNRLIDSNFFKEITKLKGVDPCAENGEYHSFVFDGPIFKSPLSFSKGHIFEKDNHWFQEISLNDEI